MTSNTENQLIEQIKGLSLEELLWLATLIEARTKELRGDAPRPTWASLAGTWKYDPGQDAQDWVRKLRDESDSQADLNS